MINEIIICCVKINRKICGLKKKKSKRKIVIKIVWKSSKINKNKNKVLKIINNNLNNNNNIIKS